MYITGKELEFRILKKSHKINRKKIDFHKMDQREKKEK